MRQILCFGDSNTYGYIPGTGKRYPYGVRWTSRLNEKLGNEYNVVEEGLCGRTSIFEDPLRAGRRGGSILPTILETHNPIDLTIIMLGTNDCKTVYGATPEIIGRGIKNLIDIVKQYAKDSEILIVSPIHLGDGVYEKEYDPEFSKESVKVSRGLADVYRRISRENGAHFLDASLYAKADEADREHLGVEGHKALFEAIYDTVLKIYK